MIVAFFVHMAPWLARPFNPALVAVIDDFNKLRIKSNNLQFYITMEILGK